MMSEIQVLVATSDTGFRGRLCSLLEDQSSIRLIGAFSSSRETLAAVREWEPDILLLDVDLEDTADLDFVCQFKHLTTKAIILGARLDTQFQVQAALSGASGAVEKAAPPADLLASIRSVILGRPWFSRDTTNALLERAESIDLPIRSDRDLTRRMPQRVLSAERRPSKFRPSSTRPVHR